MPKKHRKHTFAKPADTVHHSLLSPASRNNRNGGFRGSASASVSSSSSATASQQSTVNDLISHLRRTQVTARSSEDGDPGPSRSVAPLAPRTVHPSLRNLLELPETPPPRPRLDDPRNRGVGTRRLRRTPGPPPPQSWLLGSGASSDISQENDQAAAAITHADERRVIYRLERLPGAAFPGKRGLLHTALKSMALNWLWHVEYDGVFLARLPANVKVLLLSYVAVYAGHEFSRGLMRGFRLLFREESDELDDQSYDVGTNETDSEVSRLDLGSALGRWMTLKQLTNELVASRNQRTRDHHSHDASDPKPEDTVPTSWDEEGIEENPTSVVSQSFLPKSMDSNVRFENLRFLSLAHPNPVAANWKSLVNLLSRISTVTHLSLAHWPVPTFTPNAMNASIRHPAHKSLTFSYGGTDSYSEMENNWPEAAVILRKLARATYCLKWLDLEGCGNWIRALCWEGVGPDGEAYGMTGHVWNGSWRNIEWVGLGPGWLPPPEVDESGFGIPDGKERSGALSVNGDLSGLPHSRTLASSMHAPSSRVGENGDGSETDNLWDVEVERAKYRRTKEVERFRGLVDNAKAVEGHIQRVRREGRGKWLRSSLGFEGFENDLQKLLGQESFKLFP